jgi:transcriptional regulator with XRE-family HTH domain
MMQGMSLSQVERKVHEIGGQTELAKALGVKRSHVHLMLNGKRKPSLDVFFGMVDKLKVEPDALYKFLTNAATN